MLNFILGLPSLISFLTLYSNERDQEEDQSFRNKRGYFTVKERSRSQYTSVFENVQKIYLVLRSHSSLTAIMCKIIITQNISTHEGIG